ncbi:MAG: uncharacterized protein QOH39_3231 [Verrucomicrobiota bacterium]|jgi:DNA ligase-associated metallophosphoesterase
MNNHDLNRVEIANHVLLDGRLALFHTRRRWLAVADLHFGYELSQRTAGNLFPLWGMQTIQSRLEDLLRDYNPTHLVLLGDLVHDRSAAASLALLLRELRRQTRIVLIAGNHDRAMGKDFEMVPSWHSEGFCFHHGHCAIESTDEVQIIGHHHPAGVLRDGAGLRLKLPAFVQKKGCWILPAFSPWAAGTEWPEAESERVWLCSPTRILRIRPESAQSLAGQD